MQIFYVILLTVFLASCNGGEGATVTLVTTDEEKEIELIPLWDAYTLPALDSTYSMQNEEFYDGFMRIMGGFTSTYSNHVTTESETIYQWCYYPAGRQTKIEIQFMPINTFMESRIEGFVPEWGDKISQVLYEDDSTYLYEFFSTHDKGQRKYYNYLLERQGYYIISGPNSRYDINSHEMLLHSLAVAETFEITQHPNDHSLDDFEIFDLHFEEKKEKRGY